MAKNKAHKPKENIITKYKKKKKIIDTCDLHC